MLEIIFIAINLFLLFFIKREIDPLKREIYDLKREVYEHKRTTSDKFFIVDSRRRKLMDFLNIEHFEEHKCGLRKKKR